MLGISSAAVPASLRRTNQRTVLSLLLRLGSASDLLAELREMVKIG